MIDRVLLDKNQNVLLNLERFTGERTTAVLEENMFQVKPQGEVKTLPGSGARVLIGEEGLTAGDYSITVGAYGRSQSDTFALMGELTRAAVQTRFIQRQPGGLLEIASFLSITRTWSNKLQLGTAMKLDFAPVIPYWLVDTHTLTLNSNTPVNIPVPGDYDTPVKIEFTATSPTTNPEFITSAGTSRWYGTVQIGQVLRISSLPDDWSVTLNGVDVSLAFDGPLPRLDRGTPQFRVNGNGTVKLDWYQYSF